MSDIAKKIATETVIGFYCVLERWNASNKRYNYEDLQSLFKTKLINEVKHHINITTGINVSRYIDMAVIYKYPFIISVHINRVNYGNVKELICSLYDAFKNMDFVNLYDKRDIIQSELIKINTVKMVEDVTTLNDINFESIINIKF